MPIVTAGIDLAKNVFAVHGVDESGKPGLVRPEVPRGKLLELIAHLPPCLIACEDAINRSDRRQPSPTTLCGARHVVTTRAEWGVAERFVSGAALAVAQKARL